MAGAGVVAPPPEDPTLAYFYTHLPEVWRNDPDKMAAFSLTYGPQAVAVLNQWGKVPENANPAVVSTADEKAYFHADGSRTYLTVLDMILMYPEQRRAAVDIADSELLNLFWNNNYDLRFPAKDLSGNSAPPVSASPAKA
jgi:hypothetical protein